MMKFEYTKVPPIRLEKVIEECTRVLNEYTSRVKLDYDSFVGTWKHRPTFVVIKEDNGGTKVRRVVTTDVVFKYLEKGTRRRYAKMSANFSPKTAPGQIRSGAGSGRMSYVDRIDHGPIQPRQIRAAIQKKHAGNFHAAMRRALRRGLKASRTR